MRKHMMVFGIGLAGALVGAALLFGGLHAYRDHANLHALVDMVVAQQEAAKARAAQPLPPPAPQEKKQ